MTEDKPASLRTCVGCRQVAPATELLRFVVRDGRLVVDQLRRAPGRGAWLHPVADCVVEARRRGAFARSFRGRVDDSVLDGLDD